MPNPVQRSFGRGEISPALAGRADLDLYRAALSLQRNFITPKTGGVQNRPGTEYVGDSKAQSAIRQIPFVVSDTEAYSLVFGDATMRIVSNGGFVTESTKSITSVTLANPAVVTSTSHGYSTGDEIYISTTKLTGMPEIGGLTFIVASASANGYQLVYKQSGSLVNSTLFTAYVSGGTTARIYTLTTTFSAGAVADIDYAQFKDVMILAHSLYAPQKLTRISSSSWTISSALFNPSVSNPGSISGTAAAAGTGVQRYQITATRAGEESLLGYGAAKTIVGATQANPCVITCTAHGYVDGDLVQIYTVGGMVQLNNGIFTVASAAANTFALSGIDSTSYTAYTTGGAVRAQQISIAAGNAPTAAAPNTLTWQPVSCDTYNVYKQVNGSYVLIGTVASPVSTYTDIGAVDAIGPETPAIQSLTFATADGYHYPFGVAGDYPSCVSFSQQRLIFANSVNNPQTVWTSRIGNYYTFYSRQLPLDDDPVTFTISGSSIDPVKHLVPMRVLLCMSQGSEVIAEGPTGGDSLTPGGVNLHTDSHNGSGRVKPVVINNSVIFVQRDLRVLRDLFYNFQSNSYDGGDINNLAFHMVRNTSIVDMAYQKAPNSIIWMVTAAGDLISCTYIKDQSILAFATHDTDGAVEGVCCVPEGNETALYLTVNRFNSHRYIERMASRTVDDPTDIRDMIFVDSALGYDGRNTGSTTMTLTGSSYSAGDSCSITASTSYFASSDVGNAVFMNGTDSSGSPYTVHCTISAYTSATKVTVTLDKDAPTSLQNVAITDWALAVDEIVGLWHLEGQNIAVQGDGWVIANPNNDTYDVLTVSSGRVTLPEPHAVIWAGLPYVSDIQTCDIENPNGSSLMPLNKLIVNVSCYVNDTREFWVGEALPDDNSHEGLKPSRQHVTGEDTDLPPALLSEPVSINIKARWNKGGRVCIRNIDQLPCEIIALSPEFKVGS